MRKVAMVALASMFLVAPTVVMAETSRLKHQIQIISLLGNNSIMIITIVDTVTVCMMDVITEVIVDNVAI